MANLKKYTLLACLAALAAMLAFSSAAYAMKKIPKVDNFILFVDHYRVHGPEVHGFRR